MTSQLDNYAQLQRIMVWETTSACARATRHYFFQHRLRRVHYHDYERRRYPLDISSRGFFDEQDQVCWLG